MPPTSLPTLPSHCGASWSAGSSGESASAVASVSWTWPSGPGSRCSTCPSSSEAQGPLLGDAPRDHRSTRAGRPRARGRVFGSADPGPGRLTRQSAGASARAGRCRQCRSRPPPTPGGRASGRCPPDLLRRTTSVLREDLLEQEPHACHLVGLEDEVGDRAPALRRGLVEHHPSVREDRAAAGAPPASSTAAVHAAWPDTDGLDRRAYELHGVVDGEHRRDRSTRGVDVQADGELGVLRGQVEQLGDDRVGDAVVDLGAEVDDALGQQPGVEVEGALAPRSLLDDVGDRVGAHRAAARPMARACVGVTWSMLLITWSTNP